MEKMVVAYDVNNYIQVFDLNNNCLHPWSRVNGKFFPNNFMTRFNRIVGITALSEQKFILYSNYTYIVFDLAIDLPQTEGAAVQIIQDHPGKVLDHASSWNECIRKSQAQYLNNELYPQSLKVANSQNLKKADNGESGIC